MANKLKFILFGTFPSWRLYGVNERVKKQNKIYIHTYALKNVNTTKATMLNLHFRDSFTSKRLHITVYICLAERC